MWEEKSNVWDILLRIFIFLLAAAILVGFYFYYTHTKNEMKAQDAAYIAQYEQQQGAESEEEFVTQPILRIENLEDVQAEYEKDLASLQRYLPGIVCWGDVLTAGSAGGVSYPKAIQDLIDINICDKYDFRSTIPNPDNITRVKWEDYQVEIPVINMGIGEESTGTVLGRAGVQPYVVKKEFIIPASCDPVEVSFSAPDGDSVKPLIYGNCGVNPVTIYGVEGTLNADPSSYLPYSIGKYYFTRLIPGQEVFVSQGTQIIPAATDLYKDYIHIIFIGTYGGFDDAKQLVEQQKALLSRQTKNTDRYIVLGLYDCNDSTLSSTTFDQAESLMAQAYGDRFINLRKYLTGEAMQDAGITPTSDDSSYVRQNRVPPSLHATPYSIELNAKAYEAIGRVIYDRMNNLGYFEEVKNELGITAIEKAERQAAATAAVYS